MRRLDFRFPQAHAVLGAYNTQPRRTPATAWRASYALSRESARYNTGDGVLMVLERHLRGIYLDLRAKWEAARPSATALHPGNLAVEFRLFRYRARAAADEGNVLPLDKVH